MSKSVIHSSGVKSLSFKICRAISLIFLTIAVLIVLVYLNRNFIVKAAAEMGIQKVMGMRASIAELKLDLFPGNLEIKGLTIYNPPGFHSETLTKIPQISASFDLPALLGGKLKFHNLDLNIAEISIIKNQHRELNLNRIQAIAAANSGSPQNVPLDNKPVSFRIDQLFLTVNRIKYVDYTKKPPREKRIWLGINRERFSNLHNVDALVRLVVVRVVVKAGLNNIGLPFRNLATGIRHTGKSIQTGIEKGSSGVRRVFKTINPFKKK